MRSLLAALTLAVGCERAPAPTPAAVDVHVDDARVPSPPVAKRVNVAPPTPRIVTRVVDGQLVLEELPAETVADVARALAVSEADAGAAPVVAETRDVASNDCKPSRDAMTALQMRLRKDHTAAVAIAAESDAMMNSLGSGVCRMDKHTRSTRADLLALAGQLITDPKRKREVLEESLSLQSSATAATLLGDLADERNELRAALAYYEEAQSLKASSAVATKRRNIEKKLAVEGSFVKRGNDHFSVSFEGSARQDLGDIALEQLEAARVRLRDKLGTEPASTVQVVLYVGEQYQRAVSGPDWAGGLFDGKIRVREGQLKAETGKLADTLTHEYVHALVRQSAQQGVPAWFNEGLAQYCEPHGHRLARLSSLRGMPREKLPTLAELSRGFATLDRAKSNVYYACALDLLEEMNALKGEQALRQLFEALKADKPFDDAFQSVYGVTLARFEERWREKYPNEDRR